MADISTYPLIRHFRAEPTAYVPLDWGRRIHVAVPRERLRLVA